MAITVQVPGYNLRPEDGPGAGYVVVLYEKTDFEQHLAYDLTNGQYRDHKVLCTYYHAGLKRTEYYKTIFKDPHDVNKVFGTDILDFKPQGRFITSDLLAKPTRADVITIRNVRYTVHQIVNDGYGETIIWMDV